MVRWALATTVGTVPAVVLFLGIGTRYGFLWVAVALLGILYLGGLLAAPARWLPSISLLTAAAVPIFYLPVPSVGRLLFPSLLALLVWLARTVYEPSSRKLSPAFLLLGLSTVAWLAYRTIFSLDPMASLGWSVAFIIASLAAVRAYMMRSDAGLLLLRTWLWVGMILGLFALIEAAAGGNPLAALYARAPAPLVQHWSVYRVMTTLGHPLSNGLFFAATTLLALFAFVRNRPAEASRRLAGITTMLAAAALALTAARGAIGGLVVGAVVGLVLALWNREVSARAKVGATLALVGGAAAVWLSPIVQARNETGGEGYQSAWQRREVLRQLWQILPQDGYLGTGARTSQQRFADAGVDVVIESSAAQLAISLGIPGVLLILLLLMYFGVMAARSRRMEAAAAAAAILATTATFNALETNHQLLVLLGLLGVLAAASAGSRSPVEVAVAREPEQRVPVGARRPAFR